MAAEADQKTEAPTPRRRQEAERQGDLLQSKELGTALVLTAGASWAWIAGPLFIGACQRLLAQGLTVSRADLTHFDAARWLVRLFLPVALPVAALFGLALVASAAAPALLGSLGFRSGVFAFKASRINPIAGIKRIFSLHGLIELAKSIAKTLVVGAAGYWLLTRHVGTLFGLAAMDPRSAAGEVGRLFLLAIAVLAGSLLVIALIDVPSQVFQRNRRLRMSKEEVREDMKQTEGSPEVKRAIRQRQQEVLSGSARRAVREATVVLTNPTHFAIALRYDPMKDGAPIVVARGRGETAQAIKSLAREGAVPMLEYPQLARAIYFTSRAGQVIAEDLFVAVATVLAFVFRLDTALAEGLGQPSVLVPEGKRFDEDGRPAAT
jgi:flagellar biosynthetic protein FlhB